MASTKRDSKVGAWVSTIRKVRRDRGLSEELYPDWVVLTLIEIESGGDAFAHRKKNIKKKRYKDSQFYGLLQMGVAASKDVGQKNTDHDGNGKGAINAWFKYMEKYADRHTYNPEYIAILWKGGPGTLRDYKRTLEREGQERAEQFLASRWGGSPLIYLNRFRTKATKWSNGKAILSPASRVTPGGRRVSTLGGPLLPACTATVGNLLASPNASTTDLLTAGIASVGQFLAGNYQGAFAGFSQAAQAGAGINQTQVRVRALLDETRETSFMAFFGPSTQFVQPLVNPKVRSPFGKVRTKGIGGGRNPPSLGTDPRTGAQNIRKHKGVDYDTQANPNQPVYAVAQGVVQLSKVSTSYGNVIYIEHDNGLSTRYAHLKERRVKRGDTVALGQVIGLAGTTEGVRDAAGKVVPDHTAVRNPHLHFEMLINTGVLNTGEKKGSVTSNALNLRIDPIPILVSAANPGTVNYKQSEADKQISNAVQALGSLMLGAQTEQQHLDASKAYDNAKAMQRGQALQALKRGDHWSEEESQSKLREQRSQGVILIPESRLATAQAQGMLGAQAEGAAQLGPTPADGVATFTTTEPG